MIETLDVMLWDRKVGTLISAKTGYKNRICFYFDPAFVNGGYDIAPLRASIKGMAAKSTLPVYPDDDKLFGGLPSFIADSLPDHWGHSVFHAWAQAHHIAQRKLTSLDRLAYIGRRGMGALEFVPPVSTEMEQPFKIEIEELHAFSKQVLDEAKNMHASLSHDFVIENLFRVGTSAGGRRPKAVINVNADKTEFFSGQVPAPLPGFIPAIIKFDEHSDIPSTRIEYSYYLMALDAGLCMMPSCLLETRGAIHFLTERFDRKDNEKIHVQTLAALDPIAGTYEKLFETALKIGIAPTEMKQLFRAIVMNVACGNVDDHNKNFSFLMNKDGIWHFAPTYDFTFAINPSAPFYVNRHSMSINDKTEDITRRDLMSVAERYNIKGAEAMIEKVKDVAGNYKQYATEAGVDKRWIQRIEEVIAMRIAALR